MSDIGHFKKLVESMERSALNEDWGSSDWYPVITHMDEYIAQNGLNPETIEAAAREEAEFYHDMMGYETAEDAVDNIIGAWTRMSETGQKLGRMFAPVDEGRQELGEDQLPYDIEFDNEDLTIFTLGGKPVLEMPLDDWMALISKFNRMFGAKRI